MGLLDSLLRGSESEEAANGGASGQLGRVEPVRPTGSGVQYSLSLVPHFPSLSL